MSYLDTKVLPAPTDEIQFINHSVYALPKEIKTHIIHFYRENTSFKFLTLHKLKYLTQYYCMYYRKDLLTTSECLNLFY